VRFERPMLEASGAAIRQWAVEHRVPFVDDPSNADPRRTRNRLRAQVLPALESALPSFRETFARSARLAAQARALMHEIAIADLAIVGDPPRIAAVQDLSIGRRANVLRHWLRARHATTPSEAQVVELIEVITACTTRGHRIELRVGRGHVRRDGERLRFDALD
jgi:tRNA(Ile)-lysidine synthase